MKRLRVLLPITAILFVVWIYLVVVLVRGVRNEANKPQFEQVGEAEEQFALDLLSYYGEEEERRIIDNEPYISDTHVSIRTKTTLEYKDVRDIFFDFIHKQEGVERVIPWYGLSTRKVAGVTLNGVQYLIVYRENEISVEYFKLKQNDKRH